MTFFLRLITTGFLVSRQRHQVYLQNVEAQQKECLIWVLTEWKTYRRDGANPTPHPE